ncbi:MAG: response regulator [bacterium]|nr:response regulator [bacterium]
MKLLLVDDSHDLLAALTELLMARGIEIVGQAFDEEGALNFFKAHHPDVIILDIRLKKGSGLNVLEYIKTHNPGVTVIMLTNYPYPQYRKKCMALGADFFFDKSTEFSRAVKIVGRLCKNESLSEAGTEQSEPPEDSESLGDDIAKTARELSRQTKQLQHASAFFDRGRRGYTGDQITQRKNGSFIKDRFSIPDNMLHLYNAPVLHPTTNRGISPRDNQKGTTNDGC